MSKPADEAYDVCFSFAGEDRDYVRRVADALAEAGVRVFYDEYETVDLWGRDLYQHLSDVYRRNARFCVTFISKYYAAKLWPRHELRSAQARAFMENREYILPARFDDTEIPAVLPTTGYVDLRTTNPEELARMIVGKLGRTPPPAVSANDKSRSSRDPQPSGPSILSDQPKLKVLRRRLTEPLDEVERYHHTVQELAKLGKWSFDTTFAYPDSLVDADDRLRESLAEFGRELRTAANDLDQSFEASRPKTGTVLDAYATNYFADVARALRSAATAIDKVDVLRHDAKRGATLAVIRATEAYKAAATALNAIPGAIDAAQRERDKDDAMAAWFQNMGKNMPT